MGMTASAIRAGQAYVELFLSKDKMLADLNKTGAQMAKFGKLTSKVAKGVAMAAGAITAPFLAGAKVFADLAKDPAMAKAMGFTPDEIAAAQKLSAVFDEVVFNAKRLAATLGLAVAPILQQFSLNTIHTVDNIIKWVDANRGLLGSIFKIALSITGLAAGIAIAAKVLVNLGMGLKLASSLFGIILSPIGLAIIGIGALIYALDQTTDVFKDLKEEGLRAFGGIADALKAGNITLAVRILWLQVKFWWQKGINALYVLIDDMVAYVSEKFKQVTEGLAVIISRAAEAAGIAPAGTTDTLGGTIRSDDADRRAARAREIRDRNKDVSREMVRLQMDLADAIRTAREEAEHMAHDRTLGIPTGDIAKSSMSSQGSFNPYAAQGLQFASKTDAQLDVAKKQLDETRGLRSDLRQRNEAVFTS